MIGCENDVFGYPVRLVCDNGPTFASSELQQLCTSLAIYLKHSPLYHPQSSSDHKKCVEKNSFRAWIFAKDVNQFPRNHRNSPKTDNKIILAHQVFWFKRRNELSYLRVEQNVKTVESKKPSISFKEEEDVLYICRNQSNLF
jgi:hypothetical protein